MDIHRVQAYSLPLRNQNNLNSVRQWTTGVLRVRETHILSVERSRCLLRGRDRIPSAGDDRIIDSSCRGRSRHFIAALEHQRFKIVQDTKITAGIAYDALHFKAQRKWYAK